MRLLLWVLAVHQRGGVSVGDHPWGNQADEEERRWQGRDGRPIESWACPNKWHWICRTQCLYGQFNVGVQGEQTGVDYKCF
jgi:hypothetical protein